MLFYTQLKREFTNASWKRGQVYFREGRVKDVKLDGDQVSGQVQGSESDAYVTSITMARGSIFGSKCSCPAHKVYETHCKHVAALAIWVVERGSLLRAGIGGTDYGMVDENEVILRAPQKAAADPRLRKLMQSHPFLATSRFIVRRDLMAAFIQGRDLSGNTFSIPATLKEVDALIQYIGKQMPAEATTLDAEPILYVRGMFQSKVFAALTVEAGIRYRDPKSGTVQINTLTYLSRQPDPGVWRTTQGILLKVPTASNPEQELNFIERLETSKVIYQGQAALENLGKLLTHPFRDQMVFENTIEVKVSEVPLTLVSVNIGAKSETEKSRALIYEFQAGAVKLHSEDLDYLARLGRLSPNYVWYQDKIYPFETSLNDLRAFANRAGVAQSEEEGAPAQASGFGALFDDQENPLHPLAAYRLSLELGVKNFNVDPNWKEFHEWKKTFERKKLPALPKVPYGFKLRAYQKNGLSWLWSLYHRGLSALLADDMGLGKTHQVLAFLTSLYRAPRNKPKHPTLVVAPTSVISAWIQKLNKYKTGLKWHVFHGSGRTLPEKGVDVVLTTYGILHREPILREKQWHVVVLDEAQAIKNASTISSRASRVLKSQYRIAMTGTPIENQTTDLWSLMEFLLPGYLGSLPRFKRLYGWGREAPPEAQAAALRRLVSPFLLRRSKSQVLKELPEKIEEVTQCEMTAAQRKAYRDTLNSAEAEKARQSLQKGGKVDYANILALLTRLKQICDHPRLADVTSGKIKKLSSVKLEDSGKWETFEELMGEAIGSGLKVVVFTQYLGMIDLIAEYLAGKEIGFTELRGDTADRGGRIEKFSTDPDCRVFLCSLLAGGLGIDLTAGSVCIHFDRWWNPAKENQATDRLHRYGQTRGVQVFKFQISGSVEDRIASIIQSKTELSGALIEESSVGLKAFSHRDLLELLAPVPVAPGEELEAE